MLKDCQEDKSDANPAMFEGYTKSYQFFVYNFSLEISYYALHLTHHSMFNICDYIYGNFTTLLLLNNTQKRHASDTKNKNDMT